MSHPFTAPEAPGRRVVVELGEELAPALAALGQALGLEREDGKLDLDQLTEHLGALEEPLTLVLVGWQRLALAEPGSWTALRAVLERAAEAREDFVLVHGPISREGNPAI